MNLIYTKLKPEHIQQEGFRGFGKYEQTFLGKLTAV